MKKIMLFIALLSQTMLYGQSVPNGNFESWTSATYDYPQGYLQNSNPESFFRCSTPFNCVKTTDAYHGTYAIQLTTHTSANDTCFGYFVNTTATNGDPLTWTGGIPYNQMATGIRGYYKSNIMPGDSAGILMVFRAAGSPVGFYLYKFTGIHSAYTPFSLTFFPPLLATPDTVIFAAVSSDVFNSYAADGSMFQLDSVSFIAPSQPAAFNGDFEQWQSQTIYSPDNWYIADGNGLGYNRTTDAYAGTYAMELQTYAGDHNGNAVAQSGMVGTGYCSGNGPSCTWEGGYPFASQIDTLSFYYKYAPMGNDTASVYLMFKYNGSVVAGSGMLIENAASAYQYAEIPFNTGTPVDSVIIQLQSSVWQDTALSFIGSDFKVDNIAFKSQITGISNPFVNAVLAGSSYPNPVNNILNILLSPNSGETRLTIFDVTGRTVKEELLHSSVTIERLDVSALPSGIYIYQLSQDSGIVTNRFIKK